MRKRSRHVSVWLTDQEHAHLKEQARRAGLGIDPFIRNLIGGIESDLDDFRKFGKKNVLYAVIKDSRATDGMVDLITNVDYVSQVNYFMKSRGYDAPEQSKAEKTPKKVGPRAPRENSLEGRGSGLTASRTTTKTSARTTTPTSDKPSVKGRWEMLRAASEGMKKEQGPQQKRQSPEKGR